MGMLLDCDSSGTLVTMGALKPDGVSTAAGEANAGELTTKDVVDGSALLYEKEEERPSEETAKVPAASVNERVS